MFPKVSIIVAIYKAEEYLRRCLDSLVNQTFEDYEVLLVDDGSPDNSGYICDAYAERYPFVHVIHKANGGLASARQCGIDHARGEYTIHVDSDDWVEPDMLESLYRKAKEEDADMVICDYFEIKRKERYIAQKPTALTPDAVLRDILSGRIQAYCWNKLIRRSCYSKYQISFSIGLNFEDLFTICPLCMNDIRISYLPKAFYHYDRFINKNSLTMTPNRSNLQSRMAFVAFMENRLDSAAYREELNSLKCVVKKVAWTSGLYTRDEFRAIYPEINDVYGRYQETSSPTSKCVRLALAGHFQLAKFLYGMWRFIKRVISR